MSTEPQRICPSCGKELAGAMEFCPVCMLRMGLAGRGESGESSSENTLKPTSQHAAHRFEHYEVVKGEDGKPIELGRGAMGVTYKAFDVDLRCHVTLKVISEKYLGDESARLRFLREARAAASVHHPNVASVFHLGRTGQNYFYAMVSHSGVASIQLLYRRDPKSTPLIGQSGKTQNIPDGYLLDFSSPKKPVLYIVEVELGEHDPLRHIAQQLLGFSLSFKSTPQKMKGILRNTVQKSAEIVATCEQYAASNGFNNIDYLLEQVIYPENAFNALVIIDELDEELESILHSSLRFPVETLVIERYQSSSGELAYHFDPFLYELSAQSSTAVLEAGNTPA